MNSTKISQIPTKTIDQLLQENKTMRQLATRTGFFDYYFSECKNHKSNHAAFDAVNELFFDFFGEYRYSDFNVFKNANWHINKKK